MKIKASTRVWRILIEAGYATIEQYAQEHGVSVGKANRRLKILEQNQVQQEDALRAILAHKEKGLSLAETARQLGVTRSKVCGLLYRERQRTTAEEEALKLMASMQRVAPPKTKQVRSRVRQEVEALIAAELPEQREARINAMIWRGVETRRDKRQALAS